MVFPYFLADLSVPAEPHNALEEPPGQSNKPASESCRELRTKSLIQTQADKLRHSPRSKRPKSLPFGGHSGPWEGCKELDPGCRAGTGVQQPRNADQYFSQTSSCWRKRVLGQGICSLMSRALNLSTCTEEASEWILT